jgi:hypothetical protein
MLRNLFLAVPLAPLLLSACAPSPLYIGSARTLVSNDEVPRDGRGEPILSAIRPGPANVARPSPVLPLYPR